MNNKPFIREYVASKELTLKGVVLSVEVEYDESIVYSYCYTIYAQNRLFYYSESGAKAFTDDNNVNNPAEIYSTSIEIISEYCVIPELDNLLNKEYE